MELRRSRSRLRLVLRTTLGIGCALVLAGPGAAPPAQAGGWGGGAAALASYKGSETLELVSVGPNLARCGAHPNVEAQFEGDGIDTSGGVFSVESSGCQNVATGEIFDLVAVDTYVDGSSVQIDAASFTLVFDPATCVSTNALPVFYVVSNGTGQFAGAGGFGLFEFASNDPNCNGELAPSYVWFRGLVG